MISGGGGCTEVTDKPFDRLGHPWMPYIDRGPERGAIGGGVYLDIFVGTQIVPHGSQPASLFYLLSPSFSPIWDQNLGGTLLMD